MRPKALAFNEENVCLNPVGGAQGAWRSEGSLALRFSPQLCEDGHLSTVGEHNLETRQPAGLQPWPLDKLMLLCVSFIVRICIKSSVVSLPKGDGSL